MTNHTITDTELEAIRSVERYIATSIPRGEPFSPSQLVQEDIEAVNWMLRRLAPAPPVEEVSPTPGDWAKDLAAGRPNGEPAKSEDSQGAFVVAGESGPDISWRWAKETVGLAALELNEAYKQFVVSDEGWETPSGSLHCAAKRLNEAMGRLGIADPDRDFPF